MASATKRFRNAVSFKLSRFMPLSQTPCRKQCHLYFELRSCIVSKKKKSLHMLETCWHWHLVLLHPYLNLGAFILNAVCFHLWLKRLSRAFSENLYYWKAALIKPILEGETALIKSVLEGDHSKEGLTLELQVQNFFGPASVRWVIVAPWPGAATITAKAEQAGQTLVVVGQPLSNLSM